MFSFTCDIGFLITYRLSDLDMCQSIQKCSSMIYTTTSTTLRQQHKCERFVKATTTSPFPPAWIGTYRPMYRLFICHVSELEISINKYPCKMDTLTNMVLVMYLLLLAFMTFSEIMFCKQSLCFVNKMSAA